MNMIGHLHWVYSISTRVFIVLTDFGKMLGFIFEEIVENLEGLRSELRQSHIEYFLKCKRKRHSCIVTVILKNPNTHKTVLDLRLKVREWLELSSKFEHLLNYCHHFTLGLTPSGSPEY